MPVKSQLLRAVKTLFRPVSTVRERRASHGIRRIKKASGTRLEPHAARNSKFPIFKKLKFWVPGLQRSPDGIQNLRGGLPEPPPLEMNLPRAGAGWNRLANSKRVAVASKIVSRDDSFCNSIVSGQMKTSAKTFRISDRPISPVSACEDPP